MTTAPTARLRALLAAEFAADDAPTISSALLLLHIRTGREELRLFARHEDGDPRHEICVWKSEDDHGPFALDLIEAIHSHRLRAWRPDADGFVVGAISTITNQPTGQIGWAIGDLDKEAEAGA
ncbi:hypothetical protein [Streptomyces sp. AC1-42T]|uniref:hypothetical protein n=1 Tax=Streptomyces sp. AC1-42T TaxID=2218665 RepID=UPI000DAF3869|nr:hypothetical protein [Streptomyces sp. AC1-42T]PZT71572.1 hypothetical protein DNK55_33245 [Streptomyces sp. AC1-42T]